MVRREMEFGSIVPLLRMFDIPATRAFYNDYLGFGVDFEHRFEPELPLYMQVSRAGLVLHLSEHHGDGSPGANIRIPTQGVEALHAELHSKNYRYLRPGLETAPWGERLLILLDPAGNRLQFVEPLGKEADHG